MDTTAAERSNTAEPLQASVRPLTFAQFGCGYWGPNLLRNFTALRNCEVKYVVDPAEERRRFVGSAFPRTNVLATPDRALADPAVDAVIIAAPAGEHFDLSIRALAAGKHLFVEKPLATTVADIDALEQRAAPAGRIVMVGHTFLFNPAVRFVKSLIDSGQLGEIRYIYSQRLNLGRIRSDIDALWNFAPHDVSIIQYWLDEVAPTEVNRHGMAYIQANIEDVVFLNLTYPGRIIANIHVSWLDPQKVRRMIVVGSQRMVVYDDVADDKIAIYDKGIDRRAVLGEHMDFDRPMQFSYRTGDVLLPHIKPAEPLRIEAEHFAECIRTGAPPLTGIAHARSVVEVLERARPFQGGQS